jgi:membrane protease YdiL (CAAX protease family)
VSAPTASRRVSIPVWIGRRPLPAFTVLAYALSWACWLPLLADRQGWVGWTASPYLHLLGGLGPAVAALLVTRIVAGRAGVTDILRRCLDWRGRRGWLAAAVLGPLALFAVAVVIARMVEGSWPDLSRFGASTEYPALPLVVFWAANLLFYGFGEEIGWRGFAQPTLQRRRSALGAALAVSVIWAGWHLPLFGITATYRAMPAIGFIGFFLSMVAGALVLASLYLRSGGSILAVAAFHAAFDIATTTPTTTTMIPTLMGAVITVLAVAVIRELARTRRTNPHIDRRSFS